MLMHEAKMNQRVRIIDEELGRIFRGVVTALDGHLGCVCVKFDDTNDSDWFSPEHLEPQPDDGEG